MTGNSSYRHWRDQRGQFQSNVRSLRRDMTPCEQTLWEAVRGRAIDNVKFRRQHPFAGFVLDFYAPELRLVVEMDGDVHDDAGRQQYDAWRESKLAEHGLTVVRFRNEEIAVNLPDVLERLRGAMAEARERNR
jgi:very-short-patch-repair endonuclease